MARTIRAKRCRAKTAARQAADRETTTAGPRPTRHEVRRGGDERLADGRAEANQVALVMTAPTGGGGSEGYAGYLRAQ
jgi:hypothetical protein